MGYSRYVCPTCQKIIITPSWAWHLAIVDIDHSHDSSTSSIYLTLCLTRLCMLVFLIGQLFLKEVQPRGGLILFMPFFSYIYFLLACSLQYHLIPSWIIDVVLYPMKIDLPFLVSNLILHKVQTCKSVPHKSQ